MSNALNSSLSFAPAQVQVDTRADGTLLLRSPQELKRPARSTGEWLRRWATEVPNRPFLAERRGAEWYRLSYRHALEKVQRAAQGLLDLGLDAERPLMVLSDNSIDHALLSLAAMYVGIPYAPVSPAYSLLSRDHAKLKQIFELVKPGAVYAGEPEKFTAALAAIGRESIVFDDVIASPAGPAVDAAHDRVTPDTLAKVLFTSGSTGAPKGVINTQRMLTANQQQALQIWPFLGNEPPVIVDWLPWNHTFGGNFSIGLVLCNGGTLYIDGGKPTPALIETTVANLRDVAPTMYFNVPRGFDLLLPYLEQDADLRKRFFSRCAFVFYAAAALPQNLWQRFERLAQQERGGDLALVSAWGATETAPLCSAVHYPVSRSGYVGLPVPGCEIKLVPSAGKLEARVRGPNIMPGYYRREDLTTTSFDEEGFYRIGDALAFADAALPQSGLVFDGRVSENFKLRSGTWVHVGALRVQLLAAADPLLQDAVITGHDLDEVGALLFLNPVTTAGIPEEELRLRLGQALARLAAADAGSSVRIGRARILTEPPQSDAGEITDKGYINQRAVIDRRAAEVARLYEPQPGDTVILPVR